MLKKIEKLGEIIDFENELLFKANKKILTSLLLKG